MASDSPSIADAMGYAVVHMLQLEKKEILAPYQELREWVKRMEDLPEIKEGSLKRPCSPKEDDKKKMKSSSSFVCSSYCSKYLISRN